MTDQPSGPPPVKSTVPAAARPEPAAQPAAAPPATPVATTAPAAAPPAAQPAPAPVTPPVVAAPAPTPAPAPVVAPPVAAAAPPTPEPAPEPTPAPAKRPRGSRRREVACKEGQEAWETTTAGKVFLPYRDSRGVDRQRKHGGRKGDLIRISTENREYIEEAMANPERSPFRSGLLLQVGGERVVEAERNQIDDGEMEDAFTKPAPEFVVWVAGLNEMNLRRALTMAENEIDATTSQLTALRARVGEVGKDVATYREMAAAGDVAR